MRRHRIDPLSLLLGLLAIGMAAAGLAGVIDADWLDPAVALSIAALVGVALVIAVAANLVLRARRDGVESLAEGVDDGTHAG